MYTYDTEMKPAGPGMQLCAECVPSMLRAEGVSSVLQKGKKKMKSSKQETKTKTIFFRSPHKLLELKMETSTIFREEVMFFCSQNIRKMLTFTST